MENSRCVDDRGVEGEESMDVVSGAVERTGKVNESETNVTADNVKAAAECTVAEENKNTDVEKDEGLIKAPCSKRKRFKKSQSQTSDDFGWRWITFELC